MELIDKYKKLGIKLVNITSGGEGVSGLKHSSDAKKKMSEKAKGKIITNDTRTIYTNKITSWRIYERD
jgi:hypothetical protein